MNIDRSKVTNLDTRTGGEARFQFHVFHRGTDCIRKASRIAMLLSLVTASAAAFSPGAQMAAASYRRSTVSMSAADAVTAWLPASRDTLVSSLELIEKEYAADLGYASFSLGGANGGISCYEAPRQE